MAEIALEGVTKVFADGTKAVADVDLEIADGQFVVLVGPSGCGKTTLLRLVAGLERATEGTIRIGSRVVNSMPAKERDIAMVFQNYALYPHMSVYDNMAFGLKLQRKPKAEIDERVRAAARVLGLADQLDKKPRNISGGQRQRVAMGRAMVREPQAFLMDEPLSNLDAKLRVQMRAEIGRLQKQLGVTTVYVTHDQTEAMTLGDQVALMRHGVVQQLGEPLALYRWPANLFVAGFIGSPAMNLVEATVVAEEQQIEITFGDHRVVLDEKTLGERPALRQYHGRTVVLGIRPESIEDAALVRDARPGSRIAAVCELREQLGSETHLHFSVAAPPALTDDTRELADDTDRAAVEQIEAEARLRCTRFIARVGEDSTIAEGGRFDAHIDTRKLYFFDRDSGEAICSHGKSRERITLGVA